MKQWFWRAAFNERYRGASDSAVSADLELIQDFVVKQIGLPDQFGNVPSKDAWDRGIFRSNNSRSRAFILALALKQPRNLTNGTTIDISNALSAFNQKEFHHIYPRAHLKELGEPGEHNAIANICILIASENKKISDSAPTKYLPECAFNLGTQAETVFASNLLPSPSTFDYSHANYERFIDARVKLIAEYVQDLCDGKI